MKHRYASCGVQTIGSPRMLKLVLMTTAASAGLPLELADPTANTGVAPLIHRLDARRHAAPLYA